MNTGSRAGWPLSLAAAILLLAQGGRTASPSPSPPRPPAEGRISLVAEYRDDILGDISADGRHLLLYRTEQPTRSYTLPLTGGGRAAAPGPTRGDVLRVVERETGREVGRTGVRFFPLGAQFIPGTREVFYGEPAPPPAVAWQYKIWDPPSGRTRLCFDAPEGNLASLAFLDSRRAVGVVSKKDGGELLASVNLADCTRAVLGPADPEYPQGRTWSGLQLSPGGGFLAYTTYAGSELFIWDLAAGRVARKLTAEPLAFGDKLAYSPDGKLLIVAASANPLAAGAKNYLLFYDTQDFRRVRTLEVPELSAIAVSPDNSLLAVGLLNRRPGAPPADSGTPGIVLYDLADGRAVARVSPPAGGEPRTDPLAAKINRLAFTPDARGLLSVAGHTHMWRIDR
ncbi:MAG TPA: hypothetical protein VGX48_22885 [Pyrinomonadaceae bacterium]|jgi:hypothetical protein|nr:hypothetical protein [Pyrinomonadaceae bacterium]